MLIPKMRWIRPRTIVPITIIAILVSTKRKMRRIIVPRLYRSSKSRKYCLGFSESLITIALCLSFKPLSPISEHSLSFPVDLVMNTMWGIGLFHGQNRTIGNTEKIQLGISSSSLPVSMNEYYDSSLIWIWSVSQKIHMIGLSNESP